MPAANLWRGHALIGEPYRGATGSLIFHLRAAPGNTPDLRRVVVPLATIPTQANAWLPLRFDPISLLGGADLLFTLEIVDAAGSAAADLYLDGD